MNILELKKCCCFCVDLRCGCVVIYLVELFFAICGLCLGKWPEFHYFWFLARVGYMIHLLGTVFLLMGIILKSPRCLLVYLITTPTHIFMCTIYIIFRLIKCSFCVYISTMTTFGILCSIYCWLIVFSFRRKCIWERSIDYDGWPK